MTEEKNWSVEKDWSVAPVVTTVAPEDPRRSFTVTKWCPNELDDGPPGSWFNFGRIVFETPGE